MQHRPSRRGSRDRLLCATAVALAFTGAAAADPVADAEQVASGPRRTEQISAARTTISPYVGLQETYTDNASLTSGGRRSDFITRGLAGVRANLASARLNGELNAEYAYDWYARGNGLNGSSIYANGAGAYSLAKERLWIEADGTITSSYVSTFQTSAVDRSGVPGRTRLAIYRVGPRLAAHVGDFADLSATARYQRVAYDAQDRSSVQQLPPDSNIVQALARLDTADRFAGYSLLTTSSFVRDDHGYRAVNAVQSIYLRVARSVRLIARGGYEQTRQRGVTDISAPVLSAGFEFRPNKASRLTVEAGRRYDRMAWNAKADVQVSGRILLTGEYYETLTPDQIYAANSFERFVEQTKDLPAPVIPPAFAFRENIYNQTSYNKAGELHVIYSGKIQSLDLSGRWSDRRFLLSKTTDRSIYGSALYTRRIRPDLDLGLDLDYTRTFESPLYGASKTYALGSRLTYRVNSTTDFNTSYYRKMGNQSFKGGEKIRENLFVIAIQKRF